MTEALTVPAGAVDAAASGVVAPLRGDDMAIDLSAVDPLVVAAGMRPPDASPIDRLLLQPQGFEFHQSVRLLHALWRRLPADARPAIRFRNTLSLSFPASEVVAIDMQIRRVGGHGADDDRLDGDAPDAAAVDAVTATEAAVSTHGQLERIELTPAFMGLLGVTGALPLSYSEQFAQREAVGRDGAARAFLDIFQHRAVSLFHDAWRKHRLPLQFEADRRERYLPLVLSLVGLGEPALRQRLHAEEGGVADDALAYYAGLLQRRVVSAHHLQRVLADYFGVPVQVTQFVGRWFALDADCQVALDEFAPQRLGRDTVLGPRVWQRDLRARIEIGPMARAQHRRFLPGGPAALALSEMLTLVSGTGIEYEIHLMLRAVDVTGSTLGGIAEPDSAGPRLGWDSYLISRPCSEDRAEAVYDLHALAA